MKEAAAPLSVTAVAPVKLAPLIVTLVPATPLPGVNVTFTFAGSIFMSSSVASGIGKSHDKVSPRILFKAASSSSSAFALLPM